MHWYAPQVQSNINEISDQLLNDNSGTTNAVRSRPKQSRSQSPPHGLLHVHCMHNNKYHVHVHVTNTRARALAPPHLAVVLRAPMCLPQTIETAELNITTEKRQASSIALSPSVVRTATAPAVVALPADVLDQAVADGNVNDSLPVDVLLYSSSVNLHSIAMDTADGAAAAAANVTMSSPLISFALRQGGREIGIKGTRSSINISVPLKAGANATGACIGKPANASAAECVQFLEVTGIVCSQQCHPCRSNLPTPLFHLR